MVNISFLLFLNIPAGGILFSGPAGTKQFAADDMALDFGGPFPDALHPGVTPNTLKRQIVHKAHAAITLLWIVDQQERMVKRWLK